MWPWQAGLAAEYASQALCNAGAGGDRGSGGETIARAIGAIDSDARTTGATCR